MSEGVDYLVSNGVAVLTIDSPPVNGLGAGIRLSLDRNLMRAIDDESISAVIVTGAGKMFCAGADIRQFNTPAMSAKPLTRDILARIEKSPKPIVAAIHGKALGAGLELALGCHYRVAHRSAELGLPEIKLGLIPGGGGTQRLPRLVGIRNALEMILSGQPVTSELAKQLGLIDAIIEDENVVSAAIEFALTRVGARPPVVSKMVVRYDEDAVRRETEQVSTKKKPDAARQAALECVIAAISSEFEDGLSLERSKFEQLVEGAESKGIRHIFFAEREAQRVPGITGEVPPARIRKLALIGAGTMGAGIAMAFANSGIPVTLIDRERDAVDRGLANIGRNYEVTRKKGKLTEDDVMQRLSRIRASVDLQDAADADLVIEAVFEEMSIKKDIFRKLDGICRPDAILATNTSRLDVNEIASCISKPDRVIGLHFFSPANVMRLLEIVRGKDASPKVVSTSMDIARRIGKTPVLVGVCEGFVGNRMLTAYWRECGFLLEEGASPEQIDDAMRNFGMAMGPLAMADLAGMDINWAARKRLAPTRPAHLRYSKVADRICELGRFGQKTSAGYYKYAPGSRIPEPDPVVDEIIERCAQEAGIKRRQIPEEEIVERAIYALVNEGANILADGIAQRASDIDLVYVNGYGFPVWRGGPMFYADAIGTDKVYRKIRQWHDSEGEHWKPSRLLVELAERTATFNDKR